MDWITIGLLIFLVIIVALTALTIYNLLPLGDERRRIIQLEAGSSSFGVIIGYLLIEIVAMAYTNLATTGSYEKMNPFIVLIVFSIIYLLSLLKTKRKYS